MDHGRNWISKVMEKRGMNQLAVHSVLRLWSEGKIDEAVAHLRTQDEVAVRCPHCDLPVSRGA